MSIYLNGLKYPTLYYNGLQTSSAWYNGAKVFAKPVVAHNTTGLEHYFSGRNNSGDGFDGNLNGWLDIVTGKFATIGSATWNNGRLEFRDKNCIVRFPNKFPLQDYTISTTFVVKTYEGTTHPRLFGERPMHCGYVNHNGKTASIYTPNQDRAFRPDLIVSENVVYTFTHRYRASTKEIELFVNGKRERVDSNNNPETATAERWIGNRGTDLNRWLNGDFFEHMIYSRCLTDEEIAEEFEVAKILEKLDMERGQ